MTRVDTMTPRTRRRTALGLVARRPGRAIGGALAAALVLAIGIVVSMAGGGGSGEARDVVPVVAGFPTDIPLPDGTVVESREVGERAYTAMIELRGADDHDAALERLEGAGFVRTGEIERDGVRSYSLISGQYGVTLVLKEQGGVPVASYTVAAR